MRRMKLRVNHRQLLFLSREETSGNFQREGTLRVGRQERDLSEKFCRLRGNLLFILNKQGGKLEEVLLLERCEVMKLPHDDRRLAVSFDSGDPRVFIGCSSSADCTSWLEVLRDANTEMLRRRITHLRTLIDTHTAQHTQQHTHTASVCGRDKSLKDAAAAGGAEPAAKVTPLHLRVGVVTVAARVQIQVSVIDTHSHTLRKYCCAEAVQGADDGGVFLTSVSFCGDCPLYIHSRIKVTVYHAEEPATHTARSFLGFTSFSIRDLLRSKEPHISMSLRTMDGVSEVGEVKVSRLQMEGESEDKTPEHKCPALCDSLHSSFQDKENSPMMRAVLCAQVCKVYRFQTEDQRWLLVREQMSETPLSFSLPKQLLSALIREHTSRIQEVKELGDLSPHWNELRHDVISHCNHLIGCYQETLAELDKLSVSSCFKSSSSKSDKHLQFVPTNLHSQRMEVTSPDSSGVWYEVMTVGAPADHHQSFKHGGLKRLLSKHTSHRDRSVSYSRDESSRARELLSSVAQLQPLVFGLAEELLSVSLELNVTRLQQVLDGLTQQTELFVHALKDELVKSALLLIHRQRSDGASSHAHSNGSLCDSATANQEGQASLRQRDEYDEEEWDRAWANVAMSLNCIIAMGDRLQGREDRPQEMTSSEQQETNGDTNSQNTASPSSSSASSWQEQLLPLVVTLRDCVREAVDKARTAMTFVVLQGAVTGTVAQGPAHIVQRRHAVFSQALSAVVCGFVLKLYGGLEDPDFLQQLHSVGVLAQFEGLLSTYGDEVGMLEDMEVGVADLSSVTFTVTEAKTEQPDDLLPTLRGAWGSLVVEVPLPPETFGSLPPELREGRLIRVHPVLFNIGINQQQSLAERFGDSSLQERVNQQSCERLRAFCHSLRDTLPHTAGIQSLSDLLSSLDRSIETRKRKNVEVLWIAAMVCRKVNGVRLTSCKSAKDRTAMSVTLEQCVLLRERHTLSQQHFSTALDCMRRSRLSLGQMLGCYAQSGFTVCGLEPGEPPSGVPLCLAPKAPRRHLYPVAFLLVTSHLLVVWLILSLVILMAKYQ